MAYRPNLIIMHPGDTVFINDRIFFNLGGHYLIDRVVDGILYANNIDNNDDHCAFRVDLFKKYVFVSEDYFINMMTALSDAFRREQNTGHRYHVQLKNKLLIVRSQIQLNEQYGIRS